MANDRPTLYVGVTSNLKKRVEEHKNGIGSSFTKRYRLHKLIYYEYIEQIEMAIVREKQIKDMNRVDKLEMIENRNPKFDDLCHEILSL